MASGAELRQSAKRDEDLVEHTPLRDQTLAAHETSVAHLKRRGRNLNAGEKVLLLLVIPIRIRNRN